MLTGGRIGPLEVEHRAGFRVFRAGQLLTHEAAEVVRQAATDDTQIIFGATVDESLTGQVWVTVVATGLGAPRRRSYAGVSSEEALLEPPSFLQN